MGYLRGPGTPSRPQALEPIAGSGQITSMIGSLRGTIGNIVVSGLLARKAQVRPFLCNKLELRVHLRQLAFQFASPGACCRLGRIDASQPFDGEVRCTSRFRYDIESLLMAVSRRVDRTAQRRSRQWLRQPQLFLDRLDTRLVAVERRLSVLNRARAVVASSLFLVTETRQALNLVLEISARSAAQPLDPDHLAPASRFQPLLLRAEVPREGVEIRRHVTKVCDPIEELRSLITRRGQF